jgi:predicted aspartyl protease
MFVLTGESKSVQLPFISVNNLVVVSARLNGKLPVNLLLDTGSPSNLLLDPKITRELNQVGAREVDFSGPGTGQRKLRGKVLIGLSLEMGEILGQDLAMVATSSKPEFLKGVTKVPIHGVLGYAFFHQFVVTIDYANSLLTVSEPSYFVPALDALALPFSLSNSKPVLQTSLTFGKRTYASRLLIDTGASHDLLLHDDLGAKTKGLLLGGSEGTLGVGFGGSIHGRKGVFHQIHMGHQVDFRNVMALFPEEGQYSKTAALDQDGSIGNGLLKDYLVTIDYLRETLYLQKPGAVQQVALQTEKKDKKPLSPNRQGEATAIP